MEKFSLTSDSYQLPWHHLSKQLWWHHAVQETEIKMEDLPQRKIGGEIMKPYEIRNIRILDVFMFSVMKIHKQCFRPYLWNNKGTLKCNYLICSICIMRLFILTNIHMTYLFVEKVTGRYNQLPIVAVRFWKEVATSELLLPSSFPLSKSYLHFWQ